MDNQAFSNIYQLKDPLTGYVVSVKGDTMPSQQQQEDIFQRAGLRQKQQQQTQQSNSGNADTIDQLAGTVGGTVGQLGGTVLDPFTAGLGTEAGGALGGGLAQAIASLVQGQGLGGAASNFGQGAAFGAIPGGDESKALGLLGKGFAKKELMRAATGFAGGATAQGIKNIQNKQSPLQTNVLEAGGASGAANAIAPGITSLLGKSMKGIPPAIWQRIVGAPIDTQQEMFDETATDAVGSFNKDYAIDKDILPSAVDNNGIKQAEGLMDKKYVEDAISKRQSVSEAVEKELQSYLPEANNLTRKNIEPILDNFFQNNYPGMKSAEANKAFIADITRLAQKTGVSNSIPTSDLLSFLEKGVNKRIDVPASGSVKMINQLKRIAGRSYDEDQFSPWNGLYSDLRNFVEKNSTNPDKVASLNQEHATLMNIRNSLGKLKKNTVSYRYLGNEPVNKLEQARFGPTVGMTKELGMPVPLRLLQGGLALGGGIAGYKLGQQTGSTYGGGVGAITGGVAPYLIAGEANKLIYGLLQNPDVLESVANTVQKGMPIGKALATLLQQATVRRPQALQGSQPSP